MAGLRWLFVFLLWAALDLSGPLLITSLEAFEEPEAAAHRSAPSRRGGAPEARGPSARREEGQDDRAHRARLAVAWLPRRGPEPSIPRKLPPSDAGLDPASDDH